VSECQRRAFESAGGEDCTFGFLYPDQTWADGAFSNMAKIAATGKKLILDAGLTVNEESFVPALLDKFGSDNGHVPTVSPRQLVALALDHLDRSVEAQFRDTLTFRRSPSQLYWNVPGEGVLTRWLNPSPLMIRNRREVKSFNGSLDSIE